MATRPVQSPARRNKTPRASDRHPSSNTGMCAGTSTCSDEACQKLGLMMCVPGLGCIQCQRDVDCLDPATICVAHECTPPECRPGLDDCRFGRVCVCTEDACECKNPPGCADGTPRCGNDQDCPSDAVCQGTCCLSKACTDTCNDQNPCTDDTCVHGLCENVARTSPPAPGDANECTYDACMSMQPKYTPVPDETLCDGDKVCMGGQCVAGASCTDGDQNGDETGIDCGGECGGCAGDPCTGLGKGTCSGRPDALYCSNGICGTDSCHDGAKDNGESAIDCGGTSTCGGCANDNCTGTGKGTCSGTAGALYCAGGKCGTDSCHDGAMDNGETGVDCGGTSTCGGCAGDACTGTGKGNCSGTPTALYCSGGHCGTDSCDDGVQDGDETAADCGGSCPACYAGRSCNDIKLHAAQSLPSGIYSVTPPCAGVTADVYCDMAIEGGGWTMVQKLNRLAVEDLMFAKYDRGTLGGAWWTTATYVNAMEVLFKRGDQTFVAVSTPGEVGAQGWCLGFGAGGWARVVVPVGGTIYTSWGNPRCSMCLLAPSLDTGLFASAADPVTGLVTYELKWLGVVVATGQEGGVLDPPFEIGVRSGVFPN